MSAREIIAEIIMANRAVYNWQGPTPADVDLADAILAAMPDMIAPLVWEKGTVVGETQDAIDAPNGLVHCYRSGGYMAIRQDAAAERGLWVLRTPDGKGQIASPHRADLNFAANAHNRAAIMAAFNGEAKP
jgi:hypothetical protein